MDTAVLRLFAEVAAAGSFAPVARARGVDPSQVSRAIAGLEAELALRLFQRTTRRLALTDAGSRYLGRIAPLLDELDAAHDAAASADDLTGRLRLTASVAYGVERLVPLLPDFAARFPTLHLDLLLTDANLDLVGDQIDLAIRLGPTIPNGMIGVELHNVRYAVHASPGWRAAQAPLATPRDLAGHDCLLWSGPQARNEWQFLGPQGLPHGVTVNGRLALSNPLALRAAACAGLGPVLLPSWLVADDVAAGRLVDLLPGWRATTASFGSGAWLLYPSRAWLPARTRAMIDFLRARLAMPSAPGAAGHSLSIS